MRRLRITFVLLGLLILAPLSLVLVRAWQGIERERDARHEVIASRVFDESERALGDFLREEQGRPAEGYLEPDAAAAEEFVVGHFEIDGYGRISTRASDPAALETQIQGVLPQLRPAGPVLTEPLEKRAPSLDDERAKRKRDAARPSKVAPLNEEQAPGSTRVLQKVDPLKGAERLADKDLEVRKEAAEDDSYSSVMQRLNLGKKRAAEAEAKAEARNDLFSSLSSSSPQAPPAPEPVVAQTPLAEAAGSGAVQPRSAIEEDFAAAAPSAAPPADELERPRRLGAAASSDAAPAPAALRTSLAALRAGDRRLVLHRTVLRDGRAYGQGLLVDLPALAARLETDVLGAGGLRPYLELDFPFAGAPPPLASDRFVYEHRFQEPFDALSARLSVAPLPEEGSAGYLYALGALLVLASTAGLWAVYRRVAAAIHFSERRSNFAAAVSHELKTPLTAIRMYAEMLRDGMVPDDATRRSYLDTITSESERLTRLINNVLEFSRLERRAQDLVLVCETPLPALRAALHTLEPHARAQGFALREVSEESLPAVQFERDALQQVLFNLIDNALKYARRAERKEIEIACRACAGGVAVRVRDFGPGVAREHAPHLFEPFYRGGDELTRQTQGTGIGLALVRELAQRMGASVAAENCADGGFAVELRLRSA
jgi:signal transduction histidine kinase